jgi:hypothetical protein
MCSAPPVGCRIECEALDVGCLAREWSEWDERSRCGGTAREAVSECGLTSEFQSSERGRRDIDYRTRGARVREREANASKLSELDVCRSRRTEADFPEACGAGALAPKAFGVARRHPTNDFENSQKLS